MKGRDNLLDDAVIAYSRRTFRPQAPFSAPFIGEGAVEGGEPKREFATGGVFQSLRWMPATCASSHVVILIKHHVLSHHFE